MNEVISTGSFRVVERHGPAGRLLLRGRIDDRVEYLVIAGYAGPELPQALTNATVRVDDNAVRAETAWRITSNEGIFNLRARALDRVEECPALYQPMHSKFALAMTDRLAVRVLLGLLRLPGGARLLRLWHSRRRG